MAVGTGFGQVFRGIGKGFLKPFPLTASNSIFYQAKSVESQFHQPFSSHA
jgi:hypothetical protein